jgi:ATP-dependent DNA helicase RecG
MPQKAKSLTPSLKSATFERSLETPVQYVKGVGPRIAALLQARGLTTVGDLLSWFPRRYEDRTQVKTLAQVQPGDHTVLKLTVGSSVAKNLRQGRRLLEVRAHDDDRRWISLKWFHMYGGFNEKFKPGVTFYAMGQVKGADARLEMTHPEVQFQLEEESRVGRVIPVYSEIEGVTSKSVQAMIERAIESYLEYVVEELPDWALKKHNLPGARVALREIHFPPEGLKGAQRVNFESFRSPAQLRLIYEEFFKFEYFVLKRRFKLDQERALPLDPVLADQSFVRAQDSFPFRLTGGQQEAMREIMADVCRPHPMNRMLQADVGAGKTAVALLTAKLFIDQGFQAAIMAPTEILAEQHLSSARRLLGPDIQIHMLLGKLSAAERRVVLPEVAKATPSLVIGTHAMLQNPVEFGNLGLVVIDEQHRFGVDQRRILREKAKESAAHTLIMTATPIPRTLALTAYGDLTTSIIRERPPGRQPIRTKLIRKSDERNMHEFVRAEVVSGRQAYFIFPLVEDSEAEKFQHLMSATAEAERLANDVFPEFRVGVLHGRMSGDDKTSVMEKFSKREIDILVSTTVVEVGVDVPNATVMVVHEAERFGLSQLHQLRGRIGRGVHVSTCFLMTSRPPFIPTPDRLEVMVETEDGFQIAEADLKLRGPGEFLGTRQAGDMPFRVADLTRDQELLVKARDDVMWMLQEDPELKRIDNQAFRGYLERSGKRAGERIKTS